MYLAKNLKYLRLKNNLSQADIAEMFNYKSFTTIQKWESGITEPSIGVLKRLAEYYHIDLNSFVDVDLEMSDGIQNLQVAANTGLNLDSLSEENREKVLDYYRMIKAMERKERDED